ncbi:MAG: 16S rRNA (cytosine(967)-C(5))-methyltransferase RsmB [Dokdonella sp.]
MSTGVAVRVEAVHALARIVFDGVSLRTALASSTPRIADSRDRALLSALLFAGTRGWLRFDAALPLLMDRPLPQKLRELRTLLVLGLVQIAALELPEHAVVASAVDAAKSLGFVKQAGLVNAVLRRFLRERDDIEVKLDGDPATRFAQPRWLIDAIRADWPDHVNSILAESNVQAPLTLRVNRRVISVVAMRSKLLAAGFETETDDLLPDALILADSTDVTRMPGFNEGAFSVQDGSAQRVVELMDLRDGLRVLDACAAPGGKAAHMLERADVELLALDRDAARLDRVSTNLVRGGLNADVHFGDATQPGTWFDGRAFDRILLDAPCSALGILRRQPDIRLHRRASDVPNLVAAQSRMLDALWPLLARGGRLVYATCSILRAENENVVARFLAARDDAHALALSPEWGEAAGAGRQRLPGDRGMDGFYYAVIAKAA